MSSATDVAFVPAARSTFIPSVSAAFKSILSNPHHVRNSFNFLRFSLSYRIHQLYPSTSAHISIICSSVNVFRFIIYYFKPFSLKSLWLPYRLGKDLGVISTFFMILSSLNLRDTLFNMNIFLFEGSCCSHLTKI